MSEPLPAIRRIVTGDALLLRRPGGNLVLERLTLEGGLAQGGRGGNSTGAAGGGGGFGGAVLNEGVLRLSGTTLVLWRAPQWEA